MASTNLVKCPTPRNFRSGKVTLSAYEAECVRDGHYDKLVIMKFNGDDEVLFTKDITQKMVESIEDRGDYFLMTYR